MNKLRYVLSILLMLAFFVQVGYNGIVYSWFKLKQQYIVENECKGRFERVNTCCGSCVLKNKIESAKTKQNSQDKYYLPIVRLNFILKENLSVLRSDIIKPINLTHHLVLGYNYLYQPRFLVPPEHRMSNT